MPVDQSFDEGPEQNGFHVEPTPDPPQNLPGEPYDPNAPELPPLPPPPPPPDPENGYGDEEIDEGVVGTGLGLIGLLVVGFVGYTLIRKK